MARRKGAKVTLVHKSIGTFIQRRLEKETVEKGENGREGGERGQQYEKTVKINVSELYFYLSKLCRHCTKYSLCERCFCELRYDKIISLRFFSYLSEALNTFAVVAKDVSVPKLLIKALIS